jgi:CBS domain-containing protein
MKISDIMSSNVLSVREDSTILEAIRLMLQHGISGLVVLDKSDRLVGVVTEGDFLRRTETGTEKHPSRWLQFLVGPGKLATEYVHGSGRKVGEVMTRSPQTVTEDTPIADAVEVMEKHRIKRVPVVRGQQVVGMVSRANFLRALAGAAGDLKAPSLNDAGIREKLIAELNKQPWAVPNLLDIIVKDGVVDLWGTIVDDRTRSALMVAAENIPGVKDVRDHLVWIEPMSGTVIAPEEEVRAGHHN